MRLTVLLASLLLATGCLTGVPGATDESGWHTSSGSTDQHIEAAPVKAVESGDVDGYDGHLVSRGDLRDTLRERGGDPDAYELELFYVDEHGAWYLADEDGTVHANAPEGNVLDDVFVSDAQGTPVPDRIELDADERPGYVWTVRRVTGTPSTTVVDAETGEVLGAWTVPGRGHTSPTPTV